MSKYRCIQDMDVEERVCQNIGVFKICIQREIKVSIDSRLGRDSNINYKMRKLL